MAVTFNPVIFKRRPVDDAICAGFKSGITKIWSQSHTNDPFSNATDNTTRHKDVLYHDEIWVVSRDKEWSWQTQSLVAKKRGKIWVCSV
jgi:hypothetical protein